MENENICVICEKTTSDEDEFLEEWARFTGPIWIGEKEFGEENVIISFCSPACIVKWISENYYIDGKSVHWVPVQDEVLTI